MANIWGFLYQTLNVSIVAAVLLLVKWLLRDKLSPRWQYAVWVILALRVLVPADISRGIVPQLGLWLETAKSAAEMQLGSAYTSPFDLTRLWSVIPWPDAVPVSVTDWLFVVYTAGVVATIAWYALRYAQLRRLLRHGAPVSAEVRAAIDAAAEKYALKPCRAVAVPGLRSAFVCGVIKPVLAVPEGEAPDEKVLLHELLHLRCGDALQNVFWCFLRALQWCNPFMQYVFDRVGNDMESLCDQRVLERLDGEERREYGGILLNMADAAYARVPGTSSISNGARNIARRIEAIARFKLYPRGMALVSVCVALVLGAALMGGARAETGFADDMPTEKRDVLAALAESRMERCTTVAGALDCYIQAAKTGNVLYLATVSPLGEQEEFYDTLSGSMDWLDVKAKIDGLFYRYDRPEVYNITESDGVYRVDLVFPYVAGVDSESHEIHRMKVQKVEVYYADGGYIVRPLGEMMDTYFSRPFIGSMVSGSADCAGGRVDASMNTRYLFASFEWNKPNRSNEFMHASVNYEAKFYHDSWTFDGKAAKIVSVTTKFLDEYDPNYDVESIAFNDGTGNNESTAWTRDIIHEDTEFLTTSGGWGESPVDEIPTYCPKAVAMRVFADGEPVGGAVFELEVVE